MKKGKVLITGSQGFIGSYLCAELLAQGYEVYGIDDFSKYGAVVRPHDKHPNFHFWKGDAKDLHKEILRSNWNTFEFDYIIALAAHIGGISYFHKHAADLFLENELIMASTYEFAKARRNSLQRVIIISSSMVYERTMSYPSSEEDVWILSAPYSSYGRQKLVCEWWAEAFWEQYKIPFTIIRPFNCVGVGEEDALGDHEITSGNVKLMLSHVLPDLINKCLKGQDPLHILGSGDQIRHYTNGKDIARGIRMAMESDAATNDSFNISTPVSTSVLELAKLVWNKINPDKPFRYVSDEPYLYDVQKRVPDVSKAKNILGFETQITLDESIEEVVSYMRKRQNNE